MAYELLRELRRQGNLIDGDTVLVEVHPDVAQVLATTDHGYLEDMEKRLQKRIVVKARSSFALEDFELRSPSQKTPIDRSDADREGDRADRKRRRRKKLGPPAEVEAMLEEEERSSAVSQEEAGAGEDRTAEPRVDERSPERRGVDAAAVAGDSRPNPTDRSGATDVSRGTESPAPAAPANRSESAEAQQGAADPTLAVPASDPPKS